MYDVKLRDIELRKEEKLRVSLLEICVYNKEDLPVVSTRRCSW